MARSKANHSCLRRVLGPITWTLAAIASGAAWPQQFAVEDPSQWSARSSEGVSVEVAPVALGEGRALRVQYDFHGGAGFAGVGRPLALEFPANFELSVRLRKPAASGPVELKFIDASGDNVWWYRPAPSLFTGDWQTLRVRKRQLQFAWGPATDRTLRATARIELVVNAAREASRGELDVGEITLMPLPLPPTVWPAPIAQATGSTAGSSPAAAVDGDPHSAWHCRGAVGECALTLDYGLEREFGGLRIDWADGQRPTRYDVAVSDDARAWRTLRQLTRAGGATDWIRLGECEARYLKISVHGATGTEFALAELGLLDVAFGSDDNALVAEIARTVPRGYLPRGYTEQSYWTLVGIDGGEETGLLSEDGVVELGRGAPSIEPFVVEDGAVLSWADGEEQQTLADGYLPIPTVERRSRDFTLAVTATAATGKAGAGLFARYTLTNRTETTRHLRLALVARPFQVNPPAQFLTTPGGVSPIGKIAWDGQELTLNDDWHVVPLTAPTAADVFSFETSAIPAGIAAVAGRAPVAVSDEAQLASAVLAYDVELSPSGRAEFGLFVPWPKGGAVRHELEAADVDAAIASATDAWRRRLDSGTVRASGSAEAVEVTNALRTAHAHIILSRAGMLLRPGTRAYARSWIRDGAMMADALHRLGDEALPREYLEAYARYVFPSGKVPCCVDERGADPVPEHDSPGEFIHLAADVLRSAGGEPFVRAAWPQVRAAVGYLNQLRAEGRESAEPAFRGLLPPSISHEGYSAKPMHSYWDDFWAMRGYADAVFIATQLGQSADAIAFEAARQAFAHDVLASIDSVTRRRGIGFIPGAADLGDFDATSTTIALAPGIGDVALPPALLAGTFERYWREFVARRDGTREWRDYTPYEWRVVGTFVRLEQPQRAHEALQYFLAGRRPAGWQQWPEVIDREWRHARFIGDLPHGWVASDFLRSALDLFAFDRESDQALVLAAGLPDAWLVGNGVEVRGLRTAAGSLSYRLRRRGNRTDLVLLAGSDRPPGGFVYRPMGASPRSRALIDGKRAAFERGELHIARAPAHVTLIDS